MDVVSNDAQVVTDPNYLAASSGSHEVETQSSTEEGEPDLTDNVKQCSAYFQELSRVEELSRLLNDLRQRLNQASMQCHLLNIDVVTQYDPVQMENLRKVKMDCDKCFERITERNKTLIEKLQEP